MNVCPECYTPDGDPHRTGCKLGAMVEVEPAVLEATTLEQRQKLGEWASGLVDNPNAVAVIELFAAEAERQCLKAATTDPAAAQVHALEALIARRFLRRLQDFARDGRAAELTVKSLMQQSDTRVARTPRGRAHVRPATP